MDTNAIEAKDPAITLVIDSDAELAHWRANFRALPNCQHMRWDDVKPALKLGIDACLKANGRDVVEMLDELTVRYRRTASESRLSWEQAREVVAAVWVRVWEQNSVRINSVPEFMHIGRISQGLRVRS
ncbi:hypothetical protein ACI2IY_10285 [Lysobacter enzymogenes]|uniref:hypothetical protein n=1 Tax=Lysobacter enzymogenes TaxID=69 RepID=UPI00384F4D1A